MNLDGDEETLSRDPRVYTFIEGRLSSALRDVTSWEQVKKFVVLPRPFNVAAEELTVSLKMRRNVIFDHNRTRIEDLYRG